MRYVVIALILGLLFLSSSMALAINAADPTASFRYCADFYKIAWDNAGTDNDCVWLYGQKEIAHNTALILYNSNEADCVKHLYEVGVVKKLAAGEGTLEFGAFTDRWDGKEDDAGAMIDWSNGQFGVGTVLRTNGCSKMGFRAKIAPKTTIFMSLSEAGQSPPVYGLTHSFGKLKVELSADESTVWVRATGPAGNGFFPELRTKFTDNESFVGFGLGFAG